MTGPIPSLTEILLSKGLIGERGLIRALEHQLVYGGRLGTNLVELGYVRLDDLGRVLAVQLNVRHGENQDLASVELSTLKNVNPELCVKNQVIPLRIEGQVLHLAMADPQPERVVQLSAELGYRIVPYIVPELRLFFYLERYYRNERPGRFLRIPDGGQSSFQRRHYLSPTVDIPITSLPFPDEEGSYIVSADRAADAAIMVFSPISAGGLEGTLFKRKAETGSITSGEDRDLIYLDSVGRNSQADIVDVDIDVSSFEGFEKSSEAQLSHVLGWLAAAEGSQTIIKALVEPLYAQAELRLLFWVRGELAVACRAAGRIGKPARVPELVVPIEKSSLLHHAFETKDVIRGDAQSDAIQSLIADYIGAPPPGEVLIVPVLLSGRIIHLLCIYGRKDCYFPRSANSELQQISREATSAYLRLKAAIFAGYKIPHP